MLNFLTKITLDRRTNFKFDPQSIFFEKKKKRKIENHVEKIITTPTNKLYIYIIILEAHRNPEC